MQYFKNIANTATSFLEGMAVTLSWMFRRPYTVQWPDKIEKDLEDTLPARFRGILEVETRICIACLACMRECPIGVIAITVDRNAETKERTVSQFDVDASKCMHCGFCAAVCPTGAIRHTTQFAAADGDVRKLVLRYVEKGAPFVPMKPRAQEAGGMAPAARPIGSIVSAKINNRLSVGAAGKS